MADRIDWQATYEEGDSHIESDKRIESVHDACDEWRSLAIQARGENVDLKAQLAWTGDRLRERIKELEAKIALWEPLIEERDGLADRLSDWTMAADRHGVPDEIENDPEAAFDYVAGNARGLKWPFD